MKKVGIITIYDNNNYGNRLQNYATQIFLERLGQYDVETIKNNANLSKPQKYSSLQLRKIKNLVIKMKKFNKRKLKLYKEFKKDINFCLVFKASCADFVNNCFICGSTACAE